MACASRTCSQGKRRGGDGPRRPAATLPPSGGLRLADYADAKGFELGFLRSLGLEEIFYNGRPAVKIPYRDGGGREVAARFRLTHDGPDRFRWRKGSTPMPYGIDRLADARAAGEIVIVEGESDCQTLWAHEIPALGLPGASSWRPSWASYLTGIEVIYVVVEPDAGGSAILAWLAKSALAERARVIRLPGAKDPSDLYLQGLTTFRERWAAAAGAAVPLRDLDAQMQVEEAAGLRARAGGLADQEDILDCFARMVDSHELVAGESCALQLLYLAITSRLLDRPVSVAVKGPSAAGKSYLVEQVLRFFPASAVYELTAMTDRALAYDEEPLAHRMLVIYEASGITGEVAAFLIRTLLSEGKLRYLTVEKTEDGLRPRVIEREGPTGLIVTTTSISVHPENETRLFSIPVTDTPEQTRAVFHAIAATDPPMIDVQPLDGAPGVARDG